MNTTFPNLKKLLHLPLLASVLALALCVPLMAESDEAKCCYDMSAAPQMGSFFKDMLQQHEDLMALMKSQDAELAVQLDKMKSASPDQKQDITTSTLTLLIQQQVAQHSEMQKMLEKAKLQIEKGAWSKSQCKMMQDMAKKEKGAGEPGKGSEPKPATP